MNQTQFNAFWSQLKTPLKAKWEKITDADLLEIEGNLSSLPLYWRSDMVQPRMARSIPGPTDAILIGPETILVRTQTR